MTLGLVFWILMLIWLVFGVYWGYTRINDHYILGGNVLLFVLFLLLGWAVFGAPLRG